MKKVFFVCMCVGLLATSCNWFKKSEPNQPTIVETPLPSDSTTVTTNDSTVKKKDSTIVVVEKK